VGLADIKSLLSEE